MTGKNLKDAAMMGVCVREESGCEESVKKGRE